MKNILLIGVGGTGSNAVDILNDKISELQGNRENNIVAVVFDTDAGDIEKIRSATPIPMSDSRLVGTICDSIGLDALRTWFPCDDPNVRAQEMIRGASQWRKKSFLAFTNIIHKDETRTKFHHAMDSLLSNNPGDSYEIYTIASIAGGTGSGSFIPITLYAKRYLDEKIGLKVNATAMIACPDIYAERQTPDNLTKIYANAYAILRELNAINLVTHGHNDPTRTTATPIHFVIGNEMDPRVRTLFDADDPKYWKPEAAPFQKIFLLDKIPQLHSVVAHDIMLANSLFTTLCTQIGNAFDSEYSNHELLTSSSVGHNAIYAGIATAALTYPKDTILDYVAHRKAEAASKGEWVLLHKNTEALIEEAAEREREKHRRYVMGDGEYAEKFLACVENEIATPTSELPDIFERATMEQGVDPDQIPANRIEAYMTSLENYIKNTIPDAQSRPLDIEREMKISSKKRKATDDQRKMFVKTFRRLINDKLVDYHKCCQKAIIDTTNSLSDAILSLNPRKHPCANISVSFVYNILTIDGKYIHPVAAMNQLCKFKLALKKALPTVMQKIDASNADVGDQLPDECISTAKVPNAANSAYAKYEKRFEMIRSGGAPYINSRTKTNINDDCAVARQDLLRSLDLIREFAQSQLKDHIYEILSKRVDKLIAQYRNFFSNFESEREELLDNISEVLRTNSGTVGSVINVASSADEKEKMFAKLAKATPNSEEALLEADNVTGQSVFKVAYDAALAEMENQDLFRDRGALSQAFRSLFDSMIEAYKNQISKTPEYQKLISRNLIEIVTDTCGTGATSEDICKKLTQIFTQLQTLATPSLKSDNFKKDIPAPSTHTVYLMSADIAKYIKRNALKFGMPESDTSVSEAKQMQACVENFLAKVGASGARVAIVKGISNHTVYVTRQNLDIQPVHVRKFDELSGGDTYFEKYRKAIRNLENYGTDMWNPHLGYHLHKRGYLPYINPDMEKESDKKLAKALLYAILEGMIRYTKPSRQPAGFRYVSDNGKYTAVRNMDKQIIETKNINGLFAWLRPMEDRVDEWSKAFDAKVDAQLRTLPNVMTSGENSNLESAITKADYIAKFRDNIFGAEGEKSGLPKMGLIEFAYAVKVSEESTFDCNDAEVVLLVGYETFLRFCQARIPVNEDNLEQYAGVYTQQTDKFMTAFCESRLFHKTSDEQKETPETPKAPTEAQKKAVYEYAGQVAAWMAKNKCFRALPENGDVCGADGDFLWKVYPVNKAVELALKNNSAGGQG